MEKTGQVDLPLHYGKAPRWLFSRMVKLAGPISEIIIDEYGKDEFLRRLAEPYFFQALGCVLGFDWHSSGLTTTTTGALKLALDKRNLGIEMAGGKGQAVNVPKEIESIGDKFNLPEDKIEKLKYSSRLTAKVDNNLIQDSYQLYHHAFFISNDGKWSVIQQGMGQESWARRYHWLSDNVQDYIEHENIIASDKFHENIIDLTNKESSETRKTSLDLIKENPIHLKKFEENGEQKTINEFSKFSMPARHGIVKIDLGNFKAIEAAYQIQPKTYEEMVLIKGMGAKTIRALSLISSLIYGSKLSWKDPAKYSFCHGGKDGIPFPVDKELYDKDIELLNNAINSTKLGYNDKLNALRRLKSYC